MEEKSTVRFEIPPSLNNVDTNEPSDVDEKLRKAHPLGLQSSKSFARSGILKTELEYDDLVRRPDEADPSSTLDRMRSRFTRSKSTSNSELEENIQICIPPRNKENSGFNLDQMMERIFVWYTTWSYQTSFIKLLTFFVFMYFFWILIFALMIQPVNSAYYYNHGRECVNGWSGENSSTANFEAMFDLSWTTFSTVGYGVTAPSLEPRCFGVRFLLAFEALVGVLYAGFCGALLYSKIGRIQARAAVLFSGCGCILYGEGVSKPKGSSNLGSVYNLSIDEDATQSFPVLEIRVVHKHCNDDTKSIVGASVEMILVQKKNVKTSIHANDSSELPDSTWESPTELREKTPMTKNSFQTMKLEKASYPLFDKVWYLRHVLDADSPLLRRSTRKKIKVTGCWPSNLNDHESIRHAMVEFHKLMVIFNGTDNTTASGVYEFASYGYKDIYIGWQFAGIRYLSEDKPANEDDSESNIKVDKKLMHDITPQSGGGHEPLLHN